MQEMTETQWDEKTRKRADFCLNKCTVCKRGREKGGGIFYQLAKLESRLKFCPWCRAYEKVYGVPAYQKPPQE
ncbi:hypothetical protein [Candidatus Solincola sp.]|jgi:hypothetical protein|nr:hypothetical protein [Actinomycetota bacterium]MDI7252869.1 hypothetical protein [Actinomycetota bacterium]